MSRNALLRQAVRPDVSYGPFRFLEAIPWLMFASAMRFLAYSSGGSLGALAMILAGLAVLLAFVVGAQRMIEWAGGRTELARFEFEALVRLAGWILIQVAVLLFLVGSLLILINQPELASDLRWAFDGIAFDQPSDFGKVASSVVAALIFLAVAATGANRSPSLVDALKELVRRAIWLVPAMLLVAAMQFVLAPLQTTGRAWVYEFWHTTTAPEAIKNLVYFTFVFGFASVRLWLTLAILTFGLRLSHRGFA